MFYLLRYACVSSGMAQLSIIYYYIGTTIHIKSVFLDPIRTWYHHQDSHVGQHVPVSDGLATKPESRRPPPWATIASTARRQHECGAMVRCVGERVYSGFLYYDVGYNRKAGTSCNCCLAFFWNRSRNSHFFYPWCYFAKSKKSYIYLKNMIFQYWPCSIYQSHAYIKKIQPLKARKKFFKWLSHYFKTVLLHSAKTFRRNHEYWRCKLPPRFTMRIFKKDTFKVFAYITIICKK